MATPVDGKTLSGHRSGVVENERGSVFIVGFDNPKKPGNPAKIKVPERLTSYTKKKKTAEDIARSQELAAERRQKHDNNTARQARKVSEDAVSYDKMVQSKLHKSEPKRGKWYSHALKGD